MMRDLPAARTGGKARRAADDLAGARRFEGLRFVFRSPLIRSTMLLDFFATFFSSATALLPIFAQDVLQVGADGLRMALRRAGRGRAGDERGDGAADRADRAARADAALGGRRLSAWRPSVFGMSRSFWLTFSCLALTGATDTVSMIIRNIIRQLETPDRLARPA